MLFAVMVISSKVGANFCWSLDVVLVSHVFSDLIIPISLHSAGSSSVHYAIGDICSWSITGLVCNKYDKFCSSSASICLFSGNVENGFPCFDK